MKIDIYEFLEDFDEPSLNEDEWEEVMMDALAEYHVLYPDVPEMKFKNRISNYKSWRREKYAPEM